MAGGPYDFLCDDLRVPIPPPKDEQRKYDPTIRAPLQNYHFGQLKLFATEVYALSRAVVDHKKDSRGGPITVIYAGAASGQHIPPMAAMFPEVERWILVDPATFSFEPTDLLQQINGLFTLEMAESWRDKPNVFFLSDVRTSGDTAEEHESEISSNMTMQAEWVTAMKPRWWMLKFRVPYNIVESDTPYSYFGGELLYQAFPKELSMELRLLGTEEHASRGLTTVYNTGELERTLFYHNTVVRPKRNFFNNVFTGTQEPYGHGFDLAYDDSYVLFVMLQYTRMRKGPEWIVDSDVVIDAVTRVLNVIWPTGRRSIKERKDEIQFGGGRGGRGRRDGNRLTWPPAGFRGGRQFRGGRGGRVGREWN